ncbi:MAG: 50S ribosomal protein L19 [Dehalococcoidia bacterium]|nr:50S ribosomal protein L19 [Dehalococcoidia bacterium]
MNISSVIQTKPNPNVPKNLKPGDTVKVNVKIHEAGRERVQQFQGVIIKIQGGGQDVSFTVRRVAHNVGVERTFFTHSPILEKVERIRQGEVNRAKLYYLRKLSGRAARIKDSANQNEAPEETGAPETTEAK